MIEFFRAWFYWWTFGFRVGWWKCRHSAPERAMVFIRQGVFFDLVLAYRIYVGELGEIFAYGHNGVVYVFNQERARLTREQLKALVRAETKQEKRLAKLFEPERFDVFEDERLLFEVEGEVVASPLVGTGVPMEQDILSNFNRGDAMRQLSDSFREGGQGLNWGMLRWFILIGGIVVIGFVVWKFVLKGHIPGVVTPTPTPTPTPNPSPIYTLYSWLLWGVGNA